MRVGQEEGDTHARGAGGGQHAHTGLVLGSQCLVIAEQRLQVRVLQPPHLHQTRHARK